MHHRPLGPPRARRQIDCAHAQRSRQAAHGPAGRRPGRGGGGGGGAVLLGCLRPGRRVRSRPTAAVPVEERCCSCKAAALTCCRSYWEATLLPAVERAYGLPPNQPQVSHTSTGKFTDRTCLMQVRPAPRRAGSSGRAAGRRPARLGGQSGRGRLSAAVACRCTGFIALSAAEE